VYQIVLADDEQIERESLKDIIEKTLPDCRVVTASNGHEAVDAARHLPADTVFMDIHMPGMDGLVAARRIKSEFPNCEIMFLTAFSEFSYAKEAVDLGASGYLLKPCNSQNLLSALSRMTEKINLYRNELMMNEQRRKNMELLTKEFEEQFVLTVMGGYLRPEWVHRQLALMDVIFNNGVFLILRSPDGISAERLRGMVNGLCWRTGIYHFSYEYDDSLYIFVVSCLNKDCGNHAYELMSELCRQTKYHQNKRLMCALSEQFDKIDFVQDAFYHAFTSLQNFSDEEPVFRYVAENGNGKSGEAERLAHLVILGERESAENLIRNFLNGLCARQFEISIMITKMQKLFRCVFDNLTIESGIEYDSLFQLDEIFNRAAGIEDIYESAIRLAGEMMDCEARNFKSHMMQIKFEIEEYMKANFKRDIFMQQVAYEMNYSIAHFCRLFKSCFNKNFVTYLTEMRIKAAKDLLLNPTVSIKSIGEKVGYKDSSHFTKAFKRITGVSPSEYRCSLFPEKSHKDQP
jgi:two-component system response regulator YesN